MSEEQLPTLTLSEKLKQNENLVIRIQEILLFKRPVVFLALLVSIWGLFGFAYSIGAGFFASLFLGICFVYVLAIIYAYAGEKIEEILFKPLEAVDDKNLPNHIHSVEEITKILDKFTPKTCPFPKLKKLKNAKPIAIGVLSLILAIFFKYVKPFWFNLFVVTLVYFTPLIITLPPVYKMVSKPCKSCKSEVVEEKVAKEEKTVKSEPEEETKEEATPAESEPEPEAPAE